MVLILICLGFVTAMVVIAVLLFCIVAFITGFLQAAHEDITDRLRRRKNMKGFPDIQP